MFHKVKSVTALPEYRLLVHFTNGCAVEYDMKPVMEQMEPFQTFYHVHGLFEQVKVDAGGYGISWNDDLDLSCDELWAHGRTIVTPFDRLLSFGEATDLWGLNESTLRKAVTYRKLVEGIDAQKFGKQWVVTIDAMEREYGKPPKEMHQ